MDKQRFDVAIVVWDAASVVFHLGQLELVVKLVEITLTLTGTGTGTQLYRFL